MAIYFKKNWIPNHKLISGYLAAAAYCIFTAISAMSIHAINHQADPNVVALYTFIICNLFFNITCIGKLKYTYQLASQAKLDWFFLNLSTAFVWLTTFWGLKYLSAVLFLIIYMGAVPATAYIFTCIQYKKLKLKSLFYNAATLSIIILITIKHQQLFPAKDFYLIGIILAIISGAAVTIYMFYSSRLHTRLHLEPKQILALRFHLMVVISMGLALYDFNSAKFYQGIHLYSIIQIALASSILPLFLQQFALHNLGILKSVSLRPSIPVLTYIIEIVSGKQFNLGLFSLVIMLCIILFLSLMNHE